MNAPEVFGPPYRWTRLEVSATLAIDGRNLQVRTTVDAEAWRYEECRKAVMAELKAQLVEAMIEKIKPVIRITGA